MRPHTIHKIIMRLFMSKWLPLPNYNKIFCGKYMRAVYKL